MRLVELPSDPNLVSELARSQNPTRSEGLHVSSVLRWMESRIGKDRKPFEELSDAERVRMGGYTAGGWVWEEIVRSALVPVLGHSLHHVGEIELDGIIGSPDGLSVNGIDRVEELKGTWRSSRRDLTGDFRPWFWQIKSYCHMLQVPCARLRVFFVNGDYRESGPQIKQYEIEFTARELHDNWQMVLANAEAMQKEKGR